MKSPELQQLTASEPLTLEQEYDMQRSWREDNDSKGSPACNVHMKNDTFSLCECSKELFLSLRSFLTNIAPS